MIEDNSLGLEFKYLIVNDMDRKFGLWVNTVGYQSIPPDSPYPLKEHPSGYFFNAENENQDKDNLWENYVSDGKSYNLPGIHTDIVNKDNTETIINLINK